MRLTKEKLMSAINQPMCFCFGSRLVGKKMFAQIVKELCEYKTIEDELGIDLVTFFKALTKGFYTIREDLGLITDAELVLNHTYPKFVFIRDDSMYFYPLKDYGETWALTKEELQ